MLPHALLHPALGLLLSAAPQDGGYGPPPGMVAIPRKVVEVGADPEEIEALVLKNEAVGSNLAAELGSRTVAVEAFYVMPFELTNEQYLQFVLATGHRPPQHWGQAAVEAASREYLEATRDDKEAPPFSEKDWWKANWRDAEWSMPTEIAALPVVYVDQYDAEAYCRWAGFRLMTEFEFQAAGRDKDRQRYTWGNDWDRTRAVTSDPDQRARPEPIGSLDAGASLHGVYDLCGNVWEWTSSPYVALPGYRDLSYEVKRGKKTEKRKAVALFDSSKRVVVGGSFANTAAAARLSTRRPTERSDMFSALGFRCAADAGVARGRAAAIAAELPFAQRASIDLFPEGVLGFERWRVTEGRVEREGYALVEAHEWFVWVPHVKLAETSESGLAAASKEEPVALGVLSTTVPLAHPELEPGTYVVAWRAEGEPKRKKKEDEEKEEKRGGGDDLPPVGGAGAMAGPVAAPDDQEDPFGGLVDYEAPAWIFYDAEMVPVASLRAGEPESGRASDEHPYGRMQVLPASEVTGEEGDPRADCPVPTTLDAIRLDGFVPGGSSKRGFLFRLDLGVKAGAIDRTWRR